MAAAAMISSPKNDTDTRRHHSIWSAGCTSVDLPNRANFGTNILGYINGMIFGVLSEDELDNNDENTSGGVDKNIDIDSMADKSSSSSSCLDDDDDDDEISTDTETGYTLNSNIDADNSTTSIINYPQ